METNKGRRERETDEATQWWLSVCSRPPEEVSREEREAFTRWLRESPLHVAELLHAARVHDVLARFKLWGDIPLEQPVERNVVDLASGPVRNASVIRRRRLRHFAAAASAAAVIVAAAVLVPVTRGHAISTDVAERREVMLEDGSTVRLEPDTRLRVKMNARERRVWVESGRALFQVARDQRRPFRVAVDDTQIRALGTTFGVEHRNSDVVVTVSEGKVAVRQPDGTLDVHSAPAREVLLGAGQQLVMRNPGVSPSVRQVDTARELAWSEGRLVFDGTPLGEVVAEFNRYNHVKLRVLDRELRSRPVSGVFQASDPQTLIAFIRAGARVHVTSTTDGGRIVIVPLPAE